MFGNQSYGSAWHKATIKFVEKCILISWFWAYLEVYHWEKFLCKCLFVQYRWSVTLIAEVSSKCKHYFLVAIIIGAPQMCTNMAFTGLCKFLWNISTDILNLGKCTGLKPGELSSCGYPGWWLKTRESLQRAGVDCCVHIDLASTLISNNIWGHESWILRWKDNLTLNCCVAWLRHSYDSLVLGCPQAVQVVQYGISFVALPMALLVMKN